MLQMRNENNVTISMVGCPTHKPSDKTFPAVQLRIQQVFQASPSLLSLNDREGKMSNCGVERLSGRGSLGKLCRLMAFWRRAVESVVSSALYLGLHRSRPPFLDDVKNSIIFVV